MNRFAELLDRLAYEPGRNNKLRLLVAYFRDVGDPDRGYALAALTGALSFKHAKPGLIRDLIMERADPVLFGLSYDYVGDLSETVALMWPAPSSSHTQHDPSPLRGRVGRGVPRRRIKAKGSMRIRPRWRQSYRPPPLTPPRKGEGNSLSPLSSRPSPRLARRNCRSSWRAGLMRSTRPDAGR